MGCPDADQLTALVANALGEAECTAIASHAATCGGCHALLGWLLEPGDETAGQPAVGTSWLRAGDLVGRYVIEDRLGAGGMGVVYAAVDSELRRRVALKLLRPTGTGELVRRGSERLRREAQALAALSHPNVVAVFDIGTHGGHVFVAMELVDGDNLGGWLRRAPRSTREIVERLLEAGRGLAAAHVAGIVHRDVKPANVLIGSDGRARITDFGLARSEGDAEHERFGSDAPAPARDLTRTGTLMGTPAYMAPEQAARHAAGPLADQWAFCATLYEAVAGARPFTVEDHVARAAQIAGGQLAAPAPGRQVSGWLRAAVARGLRADPADRWPSMAALVRALERGRDRRRRIARAVAVAAGVVVAALAIATIARPGASAPRPAPAALLEWGEDQRPGCQCPFSPCVAGRCTAVCSARSFARGAPVPDINLPDRQEALHGISTDGDTILYLAGIECAKDRVMLARRRGAGFEVVDVTDQLDRARVAIFEACCTLAPDGASLILANVGRTGFVRVRVTSFTVERGSVDELGALIPEPIAGRTVRFPVMSADERTLYYRIDSRDGDGIDGVYEATRDDRATAFAPGRRLTGLAGRYDYVTGVSSDGLTLFMAADLHTSVLNRVDETAPWEGIRPAVPLPELGTWRVMPLGDCGRLLATWTVAGCAAEDIVYFDAAR